MLKIDDGWLDDWMDGENDDWWRWRTVTISKWMMMKTLWWMMITDDDHHLPLVAVRALRHDEPSGVRHHGDGLQLHPAASVGGQRGRWAGLALDRQLPHSGEPLRRRRTSSRRLLYQVGKRLIKKFSLEGSRVGALTPYEDIVRWSVLCKPTVLRKTLSAGLHNVDSSASSRP